jgi:hypothetical protein
MVFVVIEHFRPGRAPDVYRRFRDRGRMAPANVRYLSSWVDAPPLNSWWFDDLL